MSGTCHICLGPTVEDTDHPDCLEYLFDLDRRPQIDLDQARLHTVALAMVGATSISGVQRKLSMTLDRTTLQVAVSGGRYILKPASDVYPALPENEHATMRLAQIAGIAVPPAGLIPLVDRSQAFIVRRFDRMADGRKLPCEDFLQLTWTSPKDRYEVGSAEQCARVVREFSANPGADLEALYRRLAFCWWTGNGDMHLKNFSLLGDGFGAYRLSPAYDLLSTAILDALPTGARLARPIGGRNANLTPKTWRTFAGTCGLAPDRARGILEDLVGLLDTATALVQTSFLPPGAAARYCQILEARSRTFLP